MSSIATDRDRIADEPCRASWQCLPFLANTFFEPDVTSEDSEDPFVFMTSRHPIMGARFIKYSMLFGVWSGATVSTLIGAFLIVQWSICARCDRPLRWWLLVHVCLQLCQIGFRSVFFTKIHWGQSIERVDVRIAALAKTPAWRASHRLSLHTFGWLVLGVVWIINTNECGECPWLLYMSCLAVFQSCARVAFVLIYFKILFPEGISGDLEDRKVGPVAASAEQINALPVEVVYTPPAVWLAMGFGGEAATCAICLSDHGAGDHLRKLPCGHRFHVGCCDRWLQRNKVCPLCMKAIDEASQAEVISRCPRRMKAGRD